MNSSGSVEKEATVVSVQSTNDGATPDPTKNKIQNLPFSSQFLDGHEAATKARRIYLKILVSRTVIIIVAMFAVFSIYWGAVSHVPARRLEGWIVDFDGDRIGRTVVGELSRLASPALAWTVRPASDFPNGVSDLVDAVVEERCWAAVSALKVNVGSTTRLDAAVAGRSGASYDATAAITAFAVEARNENAFRTLLRPTIEGWLQNITHDFALEQFTALASNSGINLASIAPEVLVRPIYYTLDNLRPFDVPVATAVTFVGLIYLLILSFFVVNAAIMARNISGLERQLSLGSLVRVRVVTAVSIYLVLSCFYSLLTLAFKMPFNRKFGHAGFVIFWMLSWFGMMAAGLALESMITLLTVKYVQIFLILWIISNVAVSLYPIDALPKVYAYGHAAPFYQISRAVRTIVFRTKNEVGLNFGILFAWIIVSCITLPVFQWYRQREDVRAWRKLQEEAAATS